MSRSIRHELLCRGFGPAFWILPEESTAKRIALEAWETFEVLKQVQDWRGDKFPKEKHYKMVLTDEQLYQLSVLLKAEPYERERERSTSRPTIEDLVVRYVKTVVADGLRHNPFRVAVGLCQLVFDYGKTSNPARLYAIVHPDDCQNKADHNWRRMKRIIMQSLVGRFGTLLEIDAAKRNRTVFVRDEHTPESAKVVGQSLTYFSPWGAGCGHCVPKTSILCNVDRCHILINPECFMKLNKGCGLDSPWKRLAVPRFAMSDGSGDGGASKGDRWNPPKWGDRDINQAVEGLRRKSDKRKEFEPALLSILVDGEEIRRADFKHAAHIRFDVPESAGLLEIRDAESGLLLAAHLFAEWTASVGEGDAFTFRYKGRRSITIRVGYMEAEESDDLGRYVVEIGFRRESLRERVLNMTAWPRWTNRLVLAAAVLILSVFAGLLVRMFVNRPRPVQIVEHNPPAPPPPVETSPNPEQTQPRPVPQPNPAEVTEPTTSGVRSGLKTAVQLARIKTVFIEVEGLESAEPRKAILKTMGTVPSVAVTNDEEQADALLELRLAAGKRGARLTLRLVNADGKILWSRTERFPAPPAEDAVVPATRELTKQALSAIEQARSKRNASKP